MAHPLTTAQAITTHLAHERGRAAAAQGRASRSAKQTQALSLEVRLVHGRRADLIETVHRTIDESRRARARARQVRVMAARPDLVPSERYLRLIGHGPELSADE